MKNAKQFMTEMSAIHAAVVELTDHKETRVNHHNGHTLQIVLINSKYNDMKEKKKEKITKKIALTAYQALTTKDLADEVVVIYHIHGKKFGVEYNNSLDSHKFPVSELAQNTPKASPTP